MKTHENIRKNSKKKNYISKNKHFEVFFFFKKKNRYISFVIFDNNILCVDKKYKFL